MPEYLSENVISVQTLENTQTEKEEETVTIDGVTWQSEPEYDGNTEGTYIFTARLPDGYTLAYGVSLPQITVTVESDTDAVMQTLLDRIAALPDGEEYLAAEPDRDKDEEGYAAWEEKLYAYAEEALAIWEEYETLTEEQQARFSEEALEKLKVWVEIAKTAGECAQVMAAVLADSGTCGDNVNWTFDSTAGVLTISGSGPMTDYFSDRSPFYLNSDIKKIIIEDGVMSIGEFAFQQCESLTNVKIPPSVTSIGEGAFYDCTALTAVTIPDSVENIGSWAFEKCTGLTTVSFQRKEPPTAGEDIFISCTGLTNIYIPSCQYLDAYRAVEGLSAYQDKITASEHGGFTYTAAGAMITQTCTCGSVSATAELSIKEGADLDYTGSAVTPVQVTYSDDWVEQDDNKPDETSILYKDNINPGTATAELTIGGATAEISFTITLVDNTAPDKPVLQNGVTLPATWTNAQDKIPLSLYDNVGVTELWVSVDGATPYTKVNGFPGGTGSVTYDYPSVLEGEHTYRFKAVDAAGNESEKSDLFTVKLDKEKPVIGTLTYENKAKDFLDWIIGKKSMIIHVPVTDTGSGVDKISYKQTPRKADGTLDSASAEEKTAEVKDGEAKIAFDKDFRGTITINCADKAGNAADSVTIGTTDAGGVIVEDTPPVITTNAKTDYYDAPTDIQVTVKDDPENAISAGIASITYKVGENGTEQTVAVGTNALQTEITFTIPASEIPTGITEITVTATDNAGNEATKAFTVKVKGPEKTPAAEINYREEKLTGLTAGGKYTIDGTEYTADTDGCIPIKEGWFGTTLSIIKKGNGSETTDSPAQSLPIPARLTVPNAPELSTRTDSSITLKTITGAQYRRTDGTGNWQDSTAFTGLTQKTIYKFKAYYPATDTRFASLESGTSQIATMPTAPTKEKLVIGYIAETFALTDGIEAFADAGCQNPVSGGDVTVYMGQTIYIRYPANGIIPASLTTAVPVPARPAKPTPGKTDASYPTATDGAITGLASGTTYEYRVKNTDGSFGAWKNVTPSGTKIENLPAGEYEIRVKAVETGNASFQSETATVTIGELPGVKITFMADGKEYAVRYTKSGGTLTDIPSVPAKENAVGAWCMDEQGTPAVFTGITADMTVYAVYTTAYTVTLQTGSESPVKEGGSFTFRFTLSSGYQKTNSFAVKVNGARVELTAEGTYTISDIRENKTVTVEGVAKKPGKPADGGDKDKEDDPKPDPEDPANPDGPDPNTPTSEPGNPAPKPPVTPPAKTTPPAPTPGDTPPAEKQQEGRPGTKPRQEEGTEQEESGKPWRDSDTEAGRQETGGAETGTSTADSPDSQPGTADSTGSGQPTGTPTQQEEVKLGNGTVIVTVVCEEEKCTAAVADTEAVVKAVLTPDQQELVNGGETIEIRIDVTDISEKVPAQDKEVIESGIKAYSEEVPGLVLGMYVDISMFIKMFIKIGAGDWNAITATDEPIEVVVNIPEKLLSDGREFYIIRAHNGEYTFMNDIDDTPETITIRTELFSSYAIAYVETDGTSADAKCGLCHICPTFLGICYFIWQAFILAVMAIVIFVAARRRREEEQKGQG
ncbi:MAG: leucine-rich repeat protein [Lachnospiraceae bacterium]|nr:leucine-rich repeat protein [Lachnospiraceae bacterium]